MAVAAPLAAASLTATVMPRSLKEPVGLRPSNLTHTWAAPSSSAREGTGTSGVFPSSNVTGGQSGARER